MWPDRRFADLVGIEHPIVQAPMAGTCTPELAAAVAGAGGLGSLGVGRRPIAFIEAQVAALRALTNRPFNLNFFTHPAPLAAAEDVAAARAAIAVEHAAFGLGEPPAATASGPPGFDRAELELLLALRPRVASFHFGLPDPDALAALRQAGIVVGATATTSAEARAVEAAGCDFVVAQGFEAGGHRGSHAPTAPDGGIGTMALVPQVVDAVALPVIAAGGITDARGIVAALALGAAGVQLGTAFLRCPEAATDAPRRARLASATDTDTIVTATVSGRANRVTGSRWARRLNARAAAHLPFPLQYELSGPLSAAADEIAAVHQYGQAATLARELPARDLMAALLTETAECLATLARGRQR